MSDQQNRNPEHNDPQKPVPAKKPDIQPSQPVPMQQKEQVPTGLPKGPQSEQEKHDQEHKKQA